MGENKVRLRKEYKLTPTSSNFKVSFGTTNRITPSVIYLKLNTWVKYVGETKDYCENIIALNSSIKLKLKREISLLDAFQDMYFYTPEIKKILTKNNNVFHACFEFTLKQKDPILYEVNLLSTKLSALTDNVIDVIEKNRNFEFSIKK